MLVLNLPAFESKKYAAYDRFRDGNGPYGEIPTKTGPIRTLRFAVPYNKLTYFARLEKIGTHCVYVSTAMLTKCVGEWMGKLIRNKTPKGDSVGCFQWQGNAAFQ